MSKYRPRNSLTSSASCSSENGVKPTRSAKRTETRRRSAADVWVGSVWAAGCPVRAVPQSPQNLASGRLEAPQLGHGADSGCPHVSQNFRPVGLSAPQFEQITQTPRPPDESQSVLDECAEWHPREGRSWGGSREGR